MANKDFLKKVYDKYLDTDFKVGDSDLNPKREVSLENEDLLNSIDQIEDAIREQFDEIKKNIDKDLAYKVPVPKKKVSPPEEIGSLTGTPRPDVEDFRTLAEHLGGHLPAFPNLDVSDPLALQIEKYLYIASVFAGEGESENGDNIKLKPMNIPFVGMIDCRFSEESPFEEKPKGSEKDKDTHICNNKEKCLTSPGSGKLTEAADIQYMQEHNGYCPKCFENEKNKGNDPGNNPPKNPNDLPPNTSSNIPSKERESGNDYPCVLAQLRFLKMILVFVRLVKTIADTVSTVLSIAIPLCKIVSRCCGCWVNPPSAAEAIALVGEALVALLIDIMGSIIQMIWDMLQLDCLDSMAKDLKRQILEALTAIGSLANIGKSIEFVSDEVSKAYNDMKSDIQKAKTSMEDRFEDINREQDALKQLKKDLKTAKQNLKKAKKEGNETLIKSYNDEITKLENTDIPNQEQEVKKEISKKWNDDKEKANFAGNVKKQFSDFGKELCEGAGKVFDDFHIEYGELSDEAKALIDKK